MHFSQQHSNYKENSMKTIQTLMAFKHMPKPLRRRTNVRSTSESWSICKFWIPVKYVLFWSSESVYLLIWWSMFEVNNLIMVYCWRIKIESNLRDFILFFKLELYKKKKKGLGGINKVVGLYGKRLMKFSSIFRIQTLEWLRRRV